MKRLIALTMAGILLGTAALAADQHGKSKKQKNSAQAGVSSGAAKETSVAVSVSWGARDVEIVRQYYAPKYRNLPPGLQKKYARTGQLPPGWKKKVEPLPASVERECVALPAGYRRGVIDANAVIYDSRGTIIDVVVLF